MKLRRRLKGEEPISSQSKCKRISLHPPPKKKKPQSKRQKNVFSFVLACFLKPKQTVSSNYTYPTWEAPQTLIHFHKAYIAVAAWQKPTVMDNK